MSKYNKLQTADDIKWIANNILKYRKSQDLFQAFKDHKEGKVSRATFYRLYAQAQDQLSESSIFSDQGPELDRILNEAIKRVENKIKTWEQLEERYRGMMDIDIESLPEITPEQLEALPNLFTKAKDAAYVQMNAQRELINILEKAGKIVSKKNLQLSVDPEIVQLIAMLVFAKVMEVVPDKYGDDIVVKLESLEGKSREQLKLMASSQSVE